MRKLRLTSKFMKPITGKQTIQYTYYQLSQKVKTIRQ